MYRQRPDLKHRSQMLHTLYWYVTRIFPDIPKSKDVCIRAIRNRVYHEFLQYPDITSQYLISRVLLGKRVSRFPSIHFAINYLNTLVKYTPYPVQLSEPKLQDCFREAVIHGYEWRGIFNLLISSKQKISIDLILVEPVCYFISRELLSQLRISTSLPIVRNILHYQPASKHYYSRIRKIFSRLRKSQSEIYFRIVGDLLDFISIFRTTENILQYIRYSEYIY